MFRRDVFSLDDELRVYGDALLSLRSRRVDARSRTGPCTAGDDNDDAEETSGDVGDGEEVEEEEDTDIAAADDDDDSLEVIAA